MAYATMDQVREQLRARLKPHLQGWSPGAIDLLSALVTTVDAPKVRPAVLSLGLHPSSAVSAMARARLASLKAIHLHLRFWAFLVLRQSGMSSGEAAFGLRCSSESSWARTVRMQLGHTPSALTRLFTANAYFELEVLKVLNPTAEGWRHLRCAPRRTAVAA